LMVTPENKLSINGMKARIALLENYGLRWLTVLCHFCYYRNRFV
jgi:hypothetical protein